MAKVTVYAQIPKEFEITIDDKFLKLDVDQYASTQINDTVYRKKFIDHDALEEVVKLAAIKCDIEPEYINAIQDNQTGSWLYDV